MLIGAFVEEGESLEEFVDLGGVDGVVGVFLGRRPPCGAGRALCDQPVPERLGSPDVVFVVRSDRRAVGLVAVLAVLVEGDDGAGALIDLVAALVAGEANLKTDLRVKMKSSEPVLPSVPLVLLK